MQSVKAVAATGQLGSGFREESLATAVDGADFVGCDAGSTDPGPFYLGSGESHASEAAMARDLELMIQYARESGIPVVIGSAGTAGGRPHLERVARLVRRIAKDRAWHFPLALLDSEIPHETVTGALQSGQLQPLPPTRDLITHEGISRAERFVAMMGPEPFQRALREGAEVVIAGRSSDTSIYTALPMLKGIPTAVAYHAAKILECGAAAVVQRHYPDSLFANLDACGFTVGSPNADMLCTPQSVSAHTFYENSNPYRMAEPSGTLDMTDASYTAVADGTVRVTGSTFIDASDYTVRLEGARLVGFRSIVIAGVRDPLVIRQLDSYLDTVRNVIYRKVRDSLGLAEESYRLKWRIFGRNGCMGSLEPMVSSTGHEVGILMDIVADNQTDASSVASIAWHTALHHPITEYSGLLSNLALPFSPPTIPVGPVYEFCINATWHLLDPTDSFRLTMESV